MYVSVCVCVYANTSHITPSRWNLWSKEKKIKLVKVPTYLSVSTRVYVFVCLLLTLLHADTYSVDGICIYVSMRVCACVYVYVFVTYSHWPTREFLMKFFIAKKYKENINSLADNKAHPEASIGKPVALWSR